MKVQNLKPVTASAAIAIGVSAFCGSAAKVNATPSTLGFYPSTDIYGKGTSHLDVDTYGKGLNTDASVTTGLTYGTGLERDGFLGRTEMGFDYVLSLGGTAPSNLGIGTGSRMLLNAKTQLFNNDAKGSRIVAGMWGVGSKSIFAPNVGYVTGSKSFKFGRIHLGVAHSFAKDATVATPAGNSDRTNLQLGYDRYITPKLQFAADYYSGKSGYSGLQPTLYYYVNDKASFGMGYMRYNDKSVTPARNQVYVCFDYNFGGAPAAPEAPAAATPTTGTSN